MSARNRELVGLLPVALMVTAGFTAVLVAESNRLDTVTLLYGAIFLGLCLLGHIFIRISLPDADPLLFPLAAMLAAFGLVMIYRIDADLARDQAIWFVVALGVFAATVSFLRDYRVLERYRYSIAMAGLLLLLLPRVPGLGVARGGAFLSIHLGPVGFQPGELAKICIVVFLASYLYEKRELLIVRSRRILGLTIPPLRQVGPLLLIWGFAMALLVAGVQDLGTSLMFFGGFLALLYVATRRFSYVVVGSVLFAAGAWVAYQLVGHVRDRVSIWLDPWEAIYGPGYQLAGSLFAQADGGMAGRGIGESMLALAGGGSLLPEAARDMIYALIVNDLGLLGGAGIVAVYLLLAERGFRAAILVRDPFAKLLAAGLTAVFAMQVFVIVGGVVRAIPLTGVTLPLVSYGGSSLVANFILLALLLQVSDRARREIERPRVTSPIVGAEVISKLGERGASGR